MKKYILDFCRRGLIACGFGPIVLAIIYLILQQHAGVETVTVNQLCLGIFSLSALAFMAGGMNVLYHIERIPLMVAILVHGGVLYISYLLIYLINGWLEAGKISILVFSGVFVVGYLVIWVIIYSAIKRKTENLNLILKQKQQSAEEISIK